MEKPFYYLFKLILYFPFIANCVLLSLVIRVTIFVGHIPSYSNPDPKTVDMDTHLEIARSFTLLGMFDLLALPFFFLIAYFLGILIRRTIYIYILSVLCWFFLRLFIQDWLFD